MDRGQARPGPRLRRHGVEAARRTPWVKSVPEDPRYRRSWSPVTATASPVKARRAASPTMDNPAVEVRRARRRPLRAPSSGPRSSTPLVDPGWASPPAGPGRREAPPIDGNSATGLSLSQSVTISRRSRPCALPRLDLPPLAHRLVVVLPSPAWPLSHSRDDTGAGGHRHDRRGRRVRPLPRRRSARPRQQDPRDIYDCNGRPTRPGR